MYKRFWIGSEQPTFFETKQMQIFPATSALPWLCGVKRGRGGGPEQNRGDTKLAIPKKYHRAQSFHGASSVL